VGGDTGRRVHDRRDEGGSVGGEQQRLELKVGWTEPRPSVVEERDEQGVSFQMTLLRWASPWTTTPSVGFVNGSTDRRRWSCSPSWMDELGVDVVEVRRRLDVSQRAVDREGVEVGADDVVHVRVGRADRQRCLHLRWRVPGVERAHRFAELTDVDAAVLDATGQPAGQRPAQVIDLADGHERWVGNAFGKVLEHERLTPHAASNTTPADPKNELANLPRVVRVARQRDGRLGDGPAAPTTSRSRASEFHEPSSQERRSPRRPPAATYTLAAGLGGSRG